MTGKVQPQAEEDTKTDGQRPTGVAKRDPNFAEVAARAGEFAPCALTRLDVDRALAQGLPDLSDGEQRLLAFYFSHLSMVEVQNGRTCVWPGADLTQVELGKSGAVIRRRKAGLEEKGYIIRQYDGRNRPLDEGAIDLAPFLAKLPSILAAIQARRDARREAFHANRQMDVQTAKTIMNAQARKNEHQNSPPESSVCSTDFSEENLEEGRDSASTSNAEQEARQAHQDAKTVNQALSLSPQLRKLLAPENEPLSAIEALNRMPDALRTLFGSDRRGTALHTFKWALGRSGFEAFIQLAVALEDPMVKEPIRFFGKMATNAEPWDLTENIKRVREKNPAPMELDEPAGDQAKRFARILSASIGIGAYNSWFGSARTRYEFDGDTIRISVSSSFAADEIPNRFGKQLIEAVAKFGDAMKLRIGVDPSLKPPN